MPVPQLKSDNAISLTLLKRCLLVLMVCAIMQLLGQTPFAQQVKQKQKDQWRNIDKEEERRILEQSKAEFATKADPALIAARKKLLADGLFRNRRHQIQFNRAKEALQRGNDELALKYLQHLLNLRHDYFVWNEQKEMIGSLQSEIDQLFILHGNQFLKLYQEMYLEESENLLQDAQRGDDFSKYHEVVQRFFHTKAGFTAANKIATHRLDRGYFSEAAQMLQRLIRSKGHQKRITSKILLKAAFASQMTGDHDAALKMAKLTGRKPSYLAGKKLSQADIDRLFQSNQFKPHQPYLTSDWKIEGGTPLRHRPANASAPFLKADWVAKCVSQEDQRITQLISLWKMKQTSRLKPIAAQNNAIVVGNQLVVRTFREITCRDLSSGKKLWGFRNSSSLSNLNRDRSRQTSIEIPYLSNGILGHLSADNQHVYAIDDSYVLSLLLNNHSRYNVANRISIPITNRLIALDHTQITHQNHPFLKWSVGGKPGIPTWFYRADQDGNHSVSRTEYIGSQSQFQKLDINSDHVISQSEVIASNSNTKKNPLAGHLFLGAPLPVDERLFVMTFHEGIVSLALLQAETGHLISLQGIIFLPTNIQNQLSSLIDGMQLSYSKGVIVCPVWSNLLVGLDATRGKLLWVSDNLKELSITQFRRGGRFANETKLTHSGYPAAPLIDGDRIYHLPRTSRLIYCLDLNTGKKIWSVPRGDAEYIGAIRDKTMFVVGNQRIKSLSKLTGTELWEKSISIPSGTGVFTGSHYLLPLQAGEVATIDVHTGEKLGFAFRPDNPLGVQQNAINNEEQQAISHWSPGNLIAAGDKIISTSPLEVAIFPQVDLLRRQIASKKQNSKLSASDYLVLAELDLLSGQSQQSQMRLKSVSINQLNPVEIQRAKKIQREILYLDLKNPIGNKSEILAQLDRLSITPKQRGRFLMHKGEFYLQQKDFPSLIRTTTEYSKLSTTDLLSIKDDPSLLISAKGWIPQMINRAKKEMGQSVISLNKQNALKDLDKTLLSNNQEELEQFLSVYKDWMEVAAVRSQLAKIVIKQGEYQRAEFLLLQNQKSRHQQIAASATFQLFNLYHQLGLTSDAAKMLVEIEKQYSSTKLPIGITGQQFLDQFPRNDVVWIRYQQHEPLAWHVNHVSVTGKSWLDRDPYLQQTFTNYRQRILVPASSPYSLIVKHYYNGGKKLTATDRATGAITGQIPISYSYSWNYPQSNNILSENHFIPIGSSSGMVGISMLQMRDSKPLWEKKPKQFVAGIDYIKPGPSGNSFATFQVGNKLIVTDPATGNILWQRNPLPPRSGLNFNAAYGLFGDENVLVLMHGLPGKDFIIYRTSTGEEIKKGSLQRYRGFHPRVFGRLLLFQKQSLNGQGAELVLWDPLKNQNLLSQFERTTKQNTHLANITFNPKYTVTPNNELVTFQKGRLNIYNTRERKMKVSLLMQEDYSKKSALNKINVFRQGDIYFINFRQNNRIPYNRFRPQYSSNRVHQYEVSDTLIPATQIHGDLIAVEAGTSRILWQQKVEPMTVLHLPSCPLPFLVTLSRVRDGHIGNQLSLHVDLFDLKSGKSIGHRRNLLNDRIVQVTCRKEKGRIELYGLNTRIDINFSRKLQRLGQFDRK